MIINDMQECIFGGERCHAGECTPPPTSVADSGRSRHADDIYLAPGVIQSKRFTRLAVGDQEVSLHRLVLCSDLRWVLRSEGPARVRGAKVDYFSRNVRQIGARVGRAG